MHYLMFSGEVHPLIPEKYPYNSSLNLECVPGCEGIKESTKESIALSRT